MQRTLIRINVTTLHYLTLAFMIFINDAAAQSTIMNTQKEKNQDSYPSHNRQFYSQINSLIKQSKSDSAIAILYRSQAFTKIEPNEFERFRSLFLRVPPDEVYLIARRQYKLNMKEVDALRILMGINISSTINELGYSANELSKLNHLYINSDGVGEIKLGMSIHEASEKIGIDIWSTPYQYWSSECHSYALGHDRNKPTIRFITENEAITKIDIFNNAIPTDTGIKTGDSASRIIKLYSEKYKRGYAHEASMGTITVRLGEKTGYTFTVDHVVFDKATQAWKPSPDDKIRSISVGLIGAGTSEGCL